MTTRIGCAIMLYSVERNTIRSGGEGAGSKKGGKSTSGKVAVRYHPQYPSSTQPYCARTQKGPIPAMNRLRSLAEQEHPIIYIYIYIHLIYIPNCTFLAIVGPFCWTQPERSSGAPE